MRIFVAALLVVGGLGTVGQPALAAADETAPKPKVTLILTRGLRWDQLSQIPQLDWNFPHFAKLLATGTAANLVDRAVHYRSCPADGAATLSAAKRASLSLQAADTLAQCPPVPQLLSGDAPQIANFSQLREVAGAANTGAKLGTWGDALANAGITTAAVGPGAAVAVAHSDGNVSGKVVSYRADQQALTLGQTAVPLTADLVIIDLTGIEVSGTTDAQRTKQTLAQVEGVLANVPGNRAVAVASIADGESAARLQVFLASANFATEGEGGPFMVTTAKGWQTYSDSTHQMGLVQTTDLIPAVFRALKVPVPPTLPAANLQAKALAVTESEFANFTPASSVVEKRTDVLADQARHAIAAREGRTGFTVTFVGLVVLLVLFTPYLWARRKAETADPTKLLRTFEVVGLTVAALPVGAFLANAFGWWRLGPADADLAAPVFNLAAALVPLLIAAALVGLIFAALKWAKPDAPYFQIASLPSAPVFILSVITALVIVLDVCFHLGLSTDSPIALASIFGARFYGIGNTQFAILATAALILAALSYHYFALNQKRTWGMRFVIGFAIFLIIIDATPYLGTDLGGPPALLVGFTVLALLLAGLKLTGKRIGAILGLAAAFGVLIMFLDWLRPATSRSHLGNFLQAVFEGDAGSELRRKLGGMITADGWQFWQAVALTLAALAILATALAPIWSSRRGRHLYAWLLPQNPTWKMEQTHPVWPALGWSWLATMGVAMLINDSFALIPLIAFGFLAPALISYLATWLLSQKAVADEPKAAADRADNPPL